MDSSQIEEMARPNPAARDRAVVGASPGAAAAGDAARDAKIEMLFGPRRIAARVRRLAREIAADLGPDFLMVVVLKGAFVFAADLARALHAEGARPRFGFLVLSSYGPGTCSAGRVNVLGEMLDDVAGRGVLVVEDILDTGLTLAHARDRMLAHGAARVRTCVLVDKPARREIVITADYVGFGAESGVGDRFVVGYGIDHDERYRELPWLGVLAEPPE